MTLQSKRELIQAIRRVYRKASKKQKSRHLDHLELVTELKRNYLNRLLLAGYKERRKRPGRQSRYAPSSAPSSLIARNIDRFIVTSWTMVIVRIARSGNP